MFDTDHHPAASDWLTRFSSVLDEFEALPLGAFTDQQMLALWRDTETVRRRLAPIDHAVISEVQARHLHFACGARTITVLARQVLRVGISEASARVRAADALGRRRSFTGEVLAPIYGRVAAA
jgi:hypothetical protein